LLRGKLQQAHYAVRFLVHRPCHDRRRAARGCSSSRGGRGSTNGKRAGGNLPDGRCRGRKQWIAGHLPDAGVVTESGFRTDVTSPAGAAGVAQLMPQTGAAGVAQLMPQTGAAGVAQLMPQTAAQRGLVDPYALGPAILQAARLLAEFAGRFGNFGLAAAAYNAGAGRLSKWLRAQAGLPPETRLYVLAVTGHRVEDWRTHSGSGAYRNRAWRLPRRHDRSCSADLAIRLRARCFGSYGCLAGSARRVSCQGRPIATAAPGNGEPSLLLARKKRARLPGPRREPNTPRRAGRTSRLLPIAEPSRAALSRW
jgi:hypothetical protein